MTTKKLNEFIQGHEDIVNSLDVLVLLFSEGKRVVTPV